MNDWRKAFFQQAKADFQTFQLLNQQRVPESAQLTFLLMAMEKLAKAWEATAIRQPNKSHYSWVKFIKTSKSIKQIRNGFGMDFASFSAYVQSLENISQLVENLHPTYQSAVNTEYPWRDAGGEIRVPVKYNYHLISVKDANYVLLIDFLHRLFRITSDLSDFQSD